MPPLSERAQLAQAVFVAAEVIGHEISENAALAIATELESYDRAAIAKALRRCQRECTGRLTLAAILDRVDDGHIGADQAWALCPRSEEDTVVWTDEMAQAFGVAEPLLAEGDRTAARMAFRDAYTALVQQARDAQRKAKWCVSLGHDPRGRERPVRDAIALGRLPSSVETLYLPPDPPPPVRLLASGEPSTAGDAIKAFADFSGMRRGAK